MPNLGQGGCQALEDAYVLTETLLNCKSTARIESELQGFYRKRIFRVTIVQFLSRLASDLIINAFDTPWSPHDNLGKSWKSYLTFFWKVIISSSCFIFENALTYCSFAYHILSAFTTVCYISFTICLFIFLLSFWEHGWTTRGIRS